MGWYSLAGVLLTDLSSAQAGSVAFLANLMREIVSFALIPPIAKHLNHFTAIAPAGATSEDTTLPMLIRHTSEEVVVLSVFTGVLCSAAGAHCHRPVLEAAAPLIQQEKPASQEAGFFPIEGFISPV